MRCVLSERLRSTLTAILDINMRKHTLWRLSRDNYQNSVIYTVRLYTAQNEQGMASDLWQCSELSRFHEEAILSKECNMQDNYSTHIEHQEREMHQESNIQQQ